MKNRSRFTALLMAGVLVLFGSVASADTKTIQDAQDRPSDEGGIDIKSASHGHTPSGKLKHKIVSFDTNADLEQVCLHVKTSAGQFYTCGFGMYNSQDQQVGNVKEVRPNNKTIVLKFNKNAIGNPSSYSWWVVSSNYCQACDRAPNTGRARHTL